MKYECMTIARLEELSDKMDMCAEWELQRRYNAFMSGR